ncbi:hypothetical protein [Oceanicella sp. SM1341]|uniref:hypothetical protein n=1 Tax=Oceanicella sp. SM1341 TaxID=1548889 RepID=UPI000E4D557D|nr:hypothetical protein [Oceanicella sp. SM1341]
MTTRRIFVFGASGAGTTTLGRLLACALSLPHFDTDDFYWDPAPPRFSRKRPVPERLALMQALFLPGPAWVLSGAVDPWGDSIAAQFDHAFLLSLPDALRLPRLEAREAQRATSSPEATRAFLDWAALYETAGFETRSRTRQEAWADALRCPVTRLTATGTPRDTLAQALDALGLEPCAAFRDPRPPAPQPTPPAGAGPGVLKPRRD